MLLPISKIASIPVASKDSDSEEMAAYTGRGIRQLRRELRVNLLRCSTQRQKLAIKLAHTAILTCLLNARNCGGNRDIGYAQVDEQQLRRSGHLLYAPPSALAGTR